jgi:hypothetical protein
MISELAFDPAGQAPRDDASRASTLADYLIWGVTAISREINRNNRQTFHMLENGRLPARKVGGRWCASRNGLRKFFAKLVAGEAP